MDGTLQVQVGAGSLPLLEDILHIVIDNLSDDKASLSEISLVSKSLMVLARRHLFRTITVQGVSRIRDFPTFKDLLSSSQEMSYFIQNVSLVGRVSGCSIFQPSLDYHLLRQILAKLPSLRRLQLKNIMWEGQIDKDRDDSKIHEYSPTPLHNLSIISSCVQGDPERFTGKQYLFDLLALFSTIETLHYSYVDIPGPRLYSSIINSPECQKMEIPSYVRIRSFIYAGSTDPYILEAIRKSGSLDSLKDVSLHWYEWEDLVAVGAFLRGIGQGIQDLSFSPAVTFWQSEEMRDHQYRYHPDAARDHVLDLAPCLSLRSLHINHYILNELSENTHWQDAFDYIARILNTVTRSMEQFHMCFELWPMRCPEAHRIFSDIPWLLVEDALCKFLGLNRVILEVSIKRIEGNPIQIDKVQTDLAFLQRAFPRLHRKSILHVQYRESTIPRGRFSKY